MAAAAYAVLGSALSFFGFIHGTQLGWAQQPVIALGYVLLAGVCVGFAQTARGGSLAPAPAVGAD